MRSLFTLLAFVWIGLGWSWGQVTPRPRVEEQSAPYVKITRVELTKSYTIIDMRFVNTSLPRELPLFFRDQGIGAELISIDPGSRLYEPGVTSRKYAFVRAEGIPLSPESRRVYPGDTVQFRLYYERLEPGIEIFDFYEGQSTRGHQAWNFYGIHIKNPKQPPANAQARKSTPKEAPASVQPPAAEVPAPEVPSPTGTSRIVTMQGTVYDAQTKKPIPAQLSYVDEGDTLQVRTSSGKYRLGVPAGLASVQVAAKGYLGTSLALHPTDSTDRPTRDVYLVPLRSGASFTLENIYFETSKYTLLAESHPELDQLVETLLSNPTLRIRVEGHTDNVGDFDKNLELSRQRAESVKEYLVQKGVASARIDTQGYGATRPASKGTSEAERQKNRRVEVVVIET